MQLGRLIPSCLTNKSEDQSTNDDTGDNANVYERPTISGSARLSSAIDSWVDVPMPECLNVER
jgi:hypothetical protein